MDVVSGSLVKPEGGGDKIDIKRVQPVSRETGDVQPWLGRLSTRDSQKKDKLIDVMLALMNYLADGGSVASASLHLKTSLGDICRHTQGGGLWEASCGGHEAGLTWKRCVNWL